MKNTVDNPVTNPIINVYREEDNLSSNHWYGKVFQSDRTGKHFSFMVSNHLDPKKTYNWRTVGKCQAGFLTIFERDEVTPEQMSYYFSKDTKSVQAYIEFENGKGLWVDVLSFKGGRFYSVDKSILENLNISTMHSAFPKMVDYNLWETVGAKNHSHMAYKPNK
jgi:hypothetical protein